MAAYLVILNDRAALAWVIEHERMAFPPTRAAYADRLEVGDQLLLYTTRGCFGSPTNDRGRVMGLARVVSKPRHLRSPMAIATREYTSVVDLRLERLSAFRTGVELHDLVDRLSIFPKKYAWSAVLRTTLLLLPPTDAKLLVRQLEKVAERPTETRRDYVDGRGTRPSKQRPTG